tara:strand:+ start:330 stop:944 length:615 start_codon:yes stop_codon:yes gene_type:complete
MKDLRSIYFPLGSHFLTLNEINKIEEILKKFPLEDINIGDAGEVNKCKVGRLVEDHPGTIPIVVNNLLSKFILDIFESKKAKDFFTNFLNRNSPQIIRRCQFNLLSKGSFVGRHLDIDSNPDYEIASVLQLGSNFTGGEFVVYPSKYTQKEEGQIIKPKRGSLTISFCKAEHEVLEVTSGVRKSLVAFISNYTGINRRVVSSIN